MRKILLLTLLLVSIRGFSQAGYEDVIYLKNGSIIHGVIIEQIPNVSIKIKNHAGDVFFYKIEEIEKFTKEEPQAKPKQVSKFVEAAEAKPIEPKQQREKRPFAFDSISKRATGTIELGGIFGITQTLYYSSASGTFVTTGTQTAHKSSSYNGNMAEIRIIVDKPITRRFSIGGGLNFDISNSDPLDHTAHTSLIMPGYMNVKYAFLKKRVSPFLAGQIGAAFYIGNSGGGGAMAAMQFGMKAYASERVALNLSLGYRFQHINGGTYSYTDDQGNNTIQINPHFLLHFISVHFGVTF